MDDKYKDKIRGVGTNPSPTSEGPGIPKKKTPRENGETFTKDLRTKVIFIGGKNHSYGLIEGKVYYPYYESLNNYLLHNEINNIVTVPKSLFEVVDGKPYVPTYEELEKLKKDWLEDPCWDIEDTEGFEMYREKLISFREAIEAERMKKLEEYEKGVDDKANELGLEGLYRIILKHGEKLNRHEDALYELASDSESDAYRHLNGYVSE